MSDGVQAEVAALRIVLSNVVARLAAQAGPHGRPEVREMLSDMRDECRLAAERAPHDAGSDSLSKMLKNLDEFFKGITIT